MLSNIDWVVKQSWEYWWGFFGPHAIKMIRERIAKDSCHIPCKLENKTYSVKSCLLRGDKRNFTDRSWVPIDRSENINIEFRNFKVLIVT